ncbi:diheme cytochrome c-553 [Afipia sp. GAS231]|uniref:c-type cytochrome n=1 Tax=Afipia sp. GAS231 TaxID=1882747 RepID=UPI0018D4759A|nr:diheme cytochrome c-553 [Afipia sp. GAS231]
MTKDEMIKRGKYWVDVVGCEDCHTPHKGEVLGASPEDMPFYLAGHPADVKVELPVRSQPWILVTSVDHTAHAGPWGISFSANLTPDHETGLGTWTEEQFIKTLREGKVRGRGRSLLPPMPWPHFVYLKDEDLKSIFAYLRTVKAVKNRVPEPTAPAGR